MNTDFAKLLMDSNGAFAAIVLVVGWFLQHFARTSSNSLEGRSRLLEDYRFIASFFAQGIKGREPLVVEQAFYVFFKTRYTYEQIQLLLRYPNPMRAFIFFGRCGQYLKVMEGKVYYNDKYRSEAKRRYIILRNYAIYVITVGGCAIYVFYTPDLFELVGKARYFQLLTSLIFLAGMGITLLYEAVSLDMAEELINDQRMLKDCKS